MDLPQRAARLYDQVNDIAQGLVDDVWQHLPGYDDIRMDIDDLAGVVAPNIAALLHGVAEERGPDDGELARAVHLGERRAVQGVPIEAVVASWHRAERAVLTRVAAIGPPLPGTQMSQLTRRLATTVDALAVVSTEAYRRTRTEASGHLEQIATDLVSRLAGGEPLEPSDIEYRARLVGVAAQVPHRALALGSGDDDPMLLARAQRGVLEALSPRLESRALVGSRGGMAIVVVPEVPELVPTVERMVRRGPEHAVVVGVGEPRPRFGETGGSCREAMAALEVGLRRRAGPAVVRFDSVVTEVLLIENPLDAEQITRGALGPLLGREDLVRTLAAYLESGLSVRITATALGVHENTVSYRLRRITHALGVASTAGLVRADIMLALRALELGA